MLLRQFGRSDFQRQLSTRQREEFWKETCTKGHVQHVPLETVTAAWRSFVAGQSQHSGLAINSEVDPGYVSVGVTYNRRIQAAHTAPARSLLKRLLQLYRRGFPDEELFLLDVLKLCEPPQTNGRPDD
jgi:hypothetical protein